MEIIWKVYWLSLCLLFASEGLTVGGNELTSTAAPPETTSTATTKSTAKEKENREVEYNEKQGGDLDLETQDQVAILKQINRVNDDGSYTFGYEAADGSFKIETRDVNGNVKGMFGFINENGELKRVSYSASNGTGFQSSGTLNIPPLPGTTLTSDDESTQTFARLGYEQLIRQRAKETEDSSTKINLLEPTTHIYETSSEAASPRLPIYIFGSSTPRNEITSSRPVVIQHIPKVRPTPASSSTVPTESEEILLKPLLSDLAPKRTSNSNYISFGSNDSPSSSLETTTSDENLRNPSVIQLIRPRAGPYKKVIVSKRPVIATTPKVVTTTEFKSKEYLEKLKNKEPVAEVGNGVRRQLGITNNYVTSTTSNLLTSGTEDSPDVYSGGLTSRPYPTNAYRALFNQIPQHQRILQNSFIQNQNQYLSTTVTNPGVPTSTLPPLPSTQNTNQGRSYTGTSTIPPDASIPPRPSNFIPTPVPQPVPGVQIHRQFGVPANNVRQYPQSPVVPPYQQELPQQLPNQIYIPPALLEYIIRMLLAAQQRQRQQMISPFHQAVMSTLAPNNIPPELLGNNHDPRYYINQFPYPNYSPVPNSYPVAMAPRPPYNPQYSLPYYPAYVPVDPRYSYQPHIYPQIPYARYQPRQFSYEVDSTRQQQGDEFALRMLLGYSKFQPQVPVPPIQSSPGVVERSPVYQPNRDSTTSSTTPLPRVGQVRNVEILGQINDENEASRNYESSTKPEE